MEIEQHDEINNTVADVARRLQLFSRTRDPAVLWPGLTEPARVAAAREIERVTRAVLRGERHVHLDPRGLHSTYALSVAGHTTGMAPLVARWIDQGLVAAATDVGERLTEHLGHSRRRAARFDREMRPAFAALAKAGVTPLVLKGYHTAHTYFPEPGLRRMADVDMLVSADEIDTVETALRGVGFGPNTSALVPYKRDWIGPDVDPRVFSLEMTHELNRWTLELHVSLDRIFHRTAIARLDSLIGCVERARIAGHDVLVQRQPALLLTLACHCSQELDGSRLLRLYEMVEIIRADVAGGQLVWDEFLDAVRRTGAARYTYPALTLVEDLAPGTVDARALAMGHRASTWAVRHTVARLVPAGGSLDDRGIIRQVMWMSGPLAVLRRVLRMLWPTSLDSLRGMPQGWRMRFRRLRAGALSFAAPNERVLGSEGLMLDSPMASHVSHENGGPPEDLHRQAPPPRRLSRTAR